MASHFVCIAMATPNVWLAATPRTPRETRIPATLARRLPTGLTIRCTGRARGSRRQLAQSEGPPWTFCGLLTGRLVCSPPRGFFVDTRAGSSEAVDGRPFFRMTSRHLAYHPRRDPASRTDAVRSTVVSPIDRHGLFETSHEYHDTNTTFELRKVTV